MANRLTMAMIQAILQLHEQKWTNRKIAQELGVNRETVAKYIRASGCVPKPAKAPLGSDAVGGQAAEATGRQFLAGVSREEKEIKACQASPFQAYHRPIQNQPEAPLGSESKPAKAPLGSEAIFNDLVEAVSTPHLATENEVSASTISSEKGGCRSACEPYRQVILEKLEQGLSGQRIYQDLRAEGFQHEYHSVRRFVAKLRGTRPLPFRHRHRDRLADGQATALPCLSDRVELQPQGIQRGGLSSDHGRFHSLY
jgi:hypothetical protein